MLVRSAYLIGTVIKGEQEKFDAQMTGPVVEAIKGYPGLIDVVVKKEVGRDEGEEPVYMQFDLLFEDEDAMNVALASEHRNRIQLEIKKSMTAFSGRVSHSFAEILSAN